ncbi:hypothetical protein ACLOJK_026913 [Asimina triloba]
MYVKEKQLWENHLLRNRLLRYLDHRQDANQRVKRLRTRSNEATGRNAVDVISGILDTATFNQECAISAEKLVIGQMTILKEWCVTSVVCWDIPLSSVLRKVGSATAEYAEPRREAAMYSHLTLSKHESWQREWVTYESIGGRVTNYVTNGR